MTGRITRGPEPDERGGVYLKGSIAQYRNAWMHRSNHQGTGYLTSYFWDERFERIHPPGFQGGEAPDIEGNYDRLELGGEQDHYLVRRSTVGTLIIHPGTEVDFDGQEPLVVRDSLVIAGTEDEPVVIAPLDMNDMPVMRVERGPQSYVSMKWVRFESGVSTRIICDSLLVSHCEFNGGSDWTGIIQVDSSYFDSDASMTSWRLLSVQRSVMSGGLTISGQCAGRQDFQQCSDWQQQIGFAVERLR